MQEQKTLRNVRMGVYAAKKEDDRAGLWLEIPKGAWGHMGSPALVRVTASHNSGLGTLRVTVAPVACRGDGVYTVGTATRKGAEAKRVQASLDPMFNAPIPSTIKIDKVSAYLTESEDGAGRCLVAALNTNVAPPVEPKPEPFEPRLPMNQPTDAEKMVSQNAELVELQRVHSDRVEIRASEMHDLAALEVSTMQRIASALESVAITLKNLDASVTEATVPLVSLVANVREIGDQLDGAYKGKR